MDTLKFSSCILVNQLREQRSFRFGHRFVGHRKRLQFALLPIMYKMGVMTTLLTGLTVLALKGLTIGLILLFFALGKLLEEWCNDGLVFVMNLTVK